MVIRLGDLQRLESAYAMTVNEQVNPNYSKHSKWHSMVNAVGNEKKLWASSEYTAKKNGDVIKPWTVTAHDFRLNVPSNAYITKVIVEVNMKCDKGLDVNAPFAWFMVYGGTGKVKEQTKKNATGWYDNQYRVYHPRKLSSVADTFSYTFSGEEWNKMAYPSTALNKTIMGVDLHFREPNSKFKGTKKVYINWVRIKVYYEMPDLYVIYGTEFRDAYNPRTVELNQQYTVPMQFGNRTRSAAGMTEIDIELPPATNLHSYNCTAGTFEEVDAYFGKYKWTVNGKGLAKEKLNLKVSHETRGNKTVISSINDIDYLGYSYAIGDDSEYSGMLITSSEVRKANPTCFNFKARAYSYDGTVTYTVVVDGLEQADPSKLSTAFKQAYNNPDGTGNNLVDNWVLNNASHTDISIDWEHTDNNQITFNIPEDTDVEIDWTGCFVPVTVGDNELYCTSSDTGTTHTYQYTSLDPLSPIVFVTEDSDKITYWTDNWLTTKTETDAYIIPFVTKDADRVMVEGGDTFTMHIEKPKAYIGCLELPRSHYEPTSDFENKTISEQYKTKKYMGKTGEIEEDIDFKIRLPPADWTTLQGLCELDKPVPVNAVPTAFEGDVLNHRGWVELGGVKDVKKTNPLYYDGKLELDYLTHNINTKFQITRGDKIQPYGNSILKGLLDFVVESGDEFIDYIHRNSSGEYVSNETGFFSLDTDGVYIYDDELAEDSRTIITMDNEQHIIMKSVEPLKSTAEVNFHWFSSKLDENRENNVTRIVRLVNKNDDVILEYEYYDPNFNYEDGLYSCSVKCTVLNSKTQEMETVIADDDLNFAVDIEALSLKVDKFGNLVQEVEPETDDEEETEPYYIDPITGETVELVQEATIYNDYMYGSTLTFSLAGNVLDINDAGFNGREVHREDIVLPQDEYYFQVEFQNKNVDSDTPDVIHFFDFEVLEPMLVSDFGDTYSNLVVSSYPVPKKQFVFLRESEEGTLYYYHNDGKAFVYLQEPFYMYYRGVDLKANNNISIFTLNNSYTTVYIQNGLVRIGFDRLYGRIYIAKYDLQAREYVTVAGLQVNNYTQFTLGAYSDDKIEMKMKDITFTVYRGHPYVVIKHSNADLDFITLWNKVYSDSINGYEFDGLPVMWDLLNHKNLLPACVGGLDLKSSCVETEAVDNTDIGTFPTLSLTQISQTAYFGDTIVFEIDGQVSDVDEEIPIDMDFKGIFGEYSSRVEIDSDAIKDPIDLSADSRSIRIGKQTTLRAKVIDYGNRGVPNKTINFYEIT